MEIGYRTELDENYADELKAVNTQGEFEIFIEKWADWLDDSTKNLKNWDKKRLDKARRKRVEPFDVEMCALLMPIKIIKVSMVASRFHVPWGTAYIRMKEKENEI
ncbi:MAG: hypothetical protein QQN55_08490 [Nitrosopumilus sp.]